MTDHTVVDRGLLLDLLDRVERCLEEVKSLKEALKK